MRRGDERPCRPETAAKIVDLILDIIMPAEFRRSKKIVAPANEPTLERRRRGRDNGPRKQKANREVPADVMAFIVQSQGRLSLIKVERATEALGHRVSASKIHQIWLNPSKYQLA